MGAPVKNDIIQYKLPLIQLTLTCADIPANDALVAEFNEATMDIF